MHLIMVMEEHASKVQHSAQSLQCHVTKRITLTLSIERTMRVECHQEHGKQWESIVQWRPQRYPRYGIWIEKTLLSVPEVREDRLDYNLTTACIPVSKWL